MLIVGLLVTLAVLAGAPGLVVFLLIACSARGWEKIVALLVVVLIAVAWAMLFSSAGDDGFGFAAAAQGIFWLCNAIGVASGIAVRSSRPANESFSRPADAGVDIARGESAPQFSELGRNMIFALLPGLCLPAFVLYFGWFGGYSGKALVVAFVIVIVAPCCCSPQSGFRLAAG